MLARRAPRREAYTPARTVTTNSTASLRLALLLRRMVASPLKQHPDCPGTEVDFVAESRPLGVLDVVPDSLLEVPSLGSRPLSLAAPGDPRTDAQPYLTPRGPGPHSPDANPFVKLLKRLEQVSVDLEDCTQTECLYLQRKAVFPELA